MKINHTHIDDLIIRCLTEGLNQTEQNELKSWINQSEENATYFRQQQEIWFSAIQENESNLYDADKAFYLFKERTAAKPQNRTLNDKKYHWKTYLKYAAAILAIGMISYFSYQQGENNLKNELTQIEIEAPLGSQSRLRLPDNTQVVLNAGSRITYSQQFGVENREVTLEGEGYFEVTHNAEKPFRVISKNLKVRVLGTKFNFSDYPEDPVATVSLIEGKVALNNCLKAEQEMILTPSEKVILNKETKNMTKEQVTNVNNDLLWKEGKLLFNNTPLEEAIKILERSYGVTIHLKKDSLKNFQFYGNFNRREQTIHDILNALSATGKIQYSSTNKEITLY